MHPSSCFVVARHAFLVIALSAAYRGGAWASGQSRICHEPRLERRASVGPGLAL